MRIGSKSKSAFEAFWANHEGPYGYAPNTAIAKVLHGGPNVIVGAVDPGRKHLADVATIPAPDLVRYRQRNPTLLGDLPGAKSASFSSRDYRRQSLHRHRRITGADHVRRLESEVGADTIKELEVPTTYEGALLRARAFGRCGEHFMRRVLIPTHVYQLERIGECVIPIELSCILV